MQPFVSGFVALVGRPNVGKSTLLNAIVGEKVSIVANKPQTTRNRIVGVLNREHAQLVFLDTPGIHKARHRLGAYMNKVAQATLPEVDVVLFVIDATAPLGEGDQEIGRLIKQAGVPAILVVNKVDQIKRPKMYDVMDTYKGLADFIDVVPTSALTGRNVPELIELLEAQMKPGPRFYPEGMVTDQPEQLIIAELVREQILHRTREEIPHSVAAQVEELTQREDGTLYVRMVIYVERDGQKAILIGKGGSMLKEVGAAAREQIEGIFGSKVYLDLWVKVRKDWRNQTGVLRSLGYQEE